jgi:hypothetical protein
MHLREQCPRALDDGGVRERAGAEAHQAAPFGIADIQPNYSSPIASISTTTPTSRYSHVSSGTAANGFAVTRCAEVHAAHDQVAVRIAVAIRAPASPIKPLGVDAGDGDAI